MKLKTTVVILAALISASTFAESFVTVTGNPYVVNGANKAVSQGAGVEAGASWGRLMFDGTLNTDQVRKNKTRTNEVEGRATFNLLPGAWVRGGVGESLSSNNNQTYYTYAAGMTVPVVGKLSAVASAERENAIRAGGYKFSTYEAGTQYALTSTDIVGAYFVRHLGDENTRAVKLGYTKKF